jgi:formate dehydrogenase maturation protein FdhE
VTSDPPTGAQPRPELREVVELRQLRQAAPHLAAAIDLQLAVLETQRLMQARVSLPRTVRNEALLSARLRSQLRLIEFDDITFDWSDTRRLVRDAAELLRRFELVEESDTARMTALVRDAEALPAALRTWYDGPVEDGEGSARVALTPGSSQICLVAMRPYLARCAAAVHGYVQQVAGERLACPVCGGEADFTVWAASGRALVCSRCTARWSFPEGACAFCGETEPQARKSFASSSRTYRVEACQTCRRYLKGFDERCSARPLILSVDTIATLPLDAAAMQLGFE